MNLIRKKQCIRINNWLSIYIWLILKLLPYKYKLPGYLLILTGLVFTILYSLFNFQVTIPVPAILSAFTSVKFFTSYKSNFADELILLSLILGFLLVVFSKDKNEIYSLRVIRMKALLKTIIMYICFNIFTVLFVYGNFFLAFLIINLFSPFVFYLFFFSLMKLKLKRDRDKTRSIITTAKILSKK